MTKERTTIRELCRQWKIVDAKLNLDMLERDRDADDDDNTINRLMAASLERFRAIEQAILDTPMAKISDYDLGAIIDLYLHVAGDQQYADEQEERCKQMLVLVRETLIDRRLTAGLEGAASMTRLALTLELTWLKFRLWRLITTRSALRAARRVCDRIAPAA